MSWAAIYRFALRAYPEDSRARWSAEILATALRNVADQGRNTHVRELIAIVREGLDARSRGEKHLLHALAAGVSWLALPIAIMFTAISTSASLHFIALDRSLNLGLWWTAAVLATWLGLALMLAGRRRAATLALAVFAGLLAYDTWASMIGLTVRIDSPHIGRAHMVGYGGPEMAGFLVPAAGVMLLAAWHRRSAQRPRAVILPVLLIPPVIAAATFASASAMMGALVVSAGLLIAACAVVLADPRAAGAVLGLWTTLVPFVFWPLASVTDPFTRSRLAIFLVYVLIGPILLAISAYVLRRRTRSIA